MFFEVPSPVSGIIQGVLPPAALAVLMMLLPIILRCESFRPVLSKFFVDPKLLSLDAAIFEGIPLNSIVELSLMKVLTAESCYEEKLK